MPHGAQSGIAERSRGGADHRHDSGAECRGQVGPGIDYILEVMGYRLMC
jgi:hypothetical protein